MRDLLEEMVTSDDELHQMCIRDRVDMKQLMQALAAGQVPDQQILEDRKSTRLNSSHVKRSRMPSSA